MPGRLKQRRVHFFTIGNNISAVPDRCGFQLLKAEAAYGDLFRSSAGSTSRERRAKTFIIFFAGRVGTG